MADTGVDEWRNYRKKADELLNFSDAENLIKRLSSAVNHSYQEIEHLPSAALGEAASDWEPLYTTIDAMIMAVKHANAETMDGVALAKSVAAIFLMNTLRCEIKTHKARYAGSIEAIAELICETHDIRDNLAKYLAKGKNDTDDEVGKLQKKIDKAVKDADQKRSDAGVILKNDAIENGKFSKAGDYVREAINMGVLKDKYLKKIPKNFCDTTPPQPKGRLTTLYNAASTAGHAALETLRDIYRNFGRYGEFAKSSAEAIPKAWVIVKNYHIRSNKMRADAQKSLVDSVKGGSYSKADIEAVRQRMENLENEIGQAKFASYACGIQAFFATLQVGSLISNSISGDFVQAGWNFQSLHCLLPAQIAFNKQVLESDEVLHGLEAAEIDRIAHEMGLIAAGDHYVDPEAVKLNDIEPK